MQRDTGRSLLYLTDIFAWYVDHSSHGNTERKTNKTVRFSLADAKKSLKRPEMPLTVA
jgi:hypothetical protein